MKKSFPFIGIPLAMAILFGLYFFADSSLSERDRYEQFIIQQASAFSEDAKQQQDGLKAPDEPDQAAFQEYIKTLDPALGYVPKKRLLTAYHYTTAIEREQKASRDYTAPLDWTGTSANMGGRTRMMMFDPNDATNNKVWTGGVTGGLWYTTDITDVASQWVVVDDFWSNLAISSMAYDPNNKQIFYVGTGEAETATLTYRESSGLGAGIFKTSDGGTTWSLLASTADFDYITDIAVRDESGTSAIYACVASGTYEGEDHESLPSDGVFRSTDEGATWTQVLPNIVGESDPYTPSDIEIAADGRIFVGTMENLDEKGGATVLYSDDGTVGSWTIYDHYNGVIKGDADWNVPQRTILAVAPSDANRVYAQFAGGSFGGFSYSKGKYMAKSEDGGANWTSVPIPDASWSTLAWHAFALQVDPVDEELIFTGGLDLWRSEDAGSNWIKVSDWALMYSGGGDDYVHADQHNSQYKPGTSASAIFSSDGGVFLCNNADVNPPIFIERNQSYNTLQFYSGAIHPGAGEDKFLAAAQDNGTTYHQGTPVGINDMITGGDGAYCFWDENEDNIYITSYQRSRYQVWDGGSQVYGDNTATGTFISPADYDYDNNILYSNAVESFPSVYNVLYRLSGIPTTNTREIITIGSSSSVPFSHIAYSPYSPSGTSTLFVGTEAGKLYKVTGAESAASTTVEIGDPTFPSSFLSCVAIGATEDDLLVTFSNYGVSSVWLTNDGGATWEEKEANLPDMPIRWAIFHPDNSAQALLATEIGVWATNTLNDATPEWAPAVDGLANVRVDMLKLRKSDNTVMAVTHGRGVFRAEYELDGLVTLPYNESFDYGLGDCVSNSVLGDTKYWYWSSTNHFAAMNGYDQNTPEPEEDWLILPGINFDDYSDELMTFNSWYNYGSDDDNNYLKLYYSSDYPGTGDPNGSTWTELPFTHPSTYQSWTSSGVIDLSSVTGSLVYIAFKYNYNPGKYRSWIVDDFIIREGTPVDVTFQVNMEDETVSGDGVHLAGSFNDWWDPSTTEMLDGDGDDIYTVTISLYADEFYKFKYINGNAWGSEETVPDECRASNSTARFEYIGDTDYSIDAVCFGSCTDCGVLSNYDITFRVNMQEETVTGNIYLAGTFNGWSNTAMTNTSGDIWEVTLSLEENSSQQYKFKNDGEWESFFGSCLVGGEGSNRGLTVPTSVATLDLVCFNSCDLCPPPDLIISEVVSPLNSYLGRFVEIHNLGTTTIDFDYDDYYITKQADGSGLFDVKLTGSVAAGESFVLAGFSSDFNSIYGFEADQYNGTINGNGNDGYFLYFAGGYETGVLVDAYGVMNENGIGKDWNYYERKAVRLRSVSAPNTSWTASEWDIPEVAYTDDMTPSAHNEDVSWLAGATNNNWNNKSTDRWSSPYGYIPDASFNVTIVNASSYDPIINGQAACNNLTLNSDASLSITPTKPLTVYGDLSIAASKSRAAASFFINSGTNGNASLIVDGSVSGTAVIERYFEGYDDAAPDGWHIIASPVNNMAIAASEFDPTATEDDLYRWDEPSGWWQNYKQNHFTHFSNGDGYLFAIKNTDNRSFEGTINNADITKSNLHFDTDGWHLLGNPFPSALEWNTTDWSVTGIGAVAEIWDNNAGNYTPINPGDIIPSTNGFFVQVDNTSNSLTIPLSARLHDATNNYKSMQTDEMTETLVMKISNDENGYFDINRIGFKAEASEKWDIDFDAHKLPGSATAPQIWTVSNNENFAQNYLPYVYEVYQVPLHFKAGTNSMHHFVFEGMGSFSGDSRIYLEDLLLKKTIDLRTQQAYDFMASTEDNEGRFILHFNGVTATAEILDPDAISIYSSQNTVYIQSGKMASEKYNVEVFNLRGQLIYTESMEPTTLSSFTLNEKTGIYIVRLHNNNRSITQKVMIYSNNN